MSSQTYSVSGAASFPSPTKGPASTILSRGHSEYHHTRASPHGVQRFRAPARRRRLLVDMRLCRRPHPPRSHWSGADVGSAPAPVPAVPRPRHAGLSGGRRRSARIVSRAASLPQPSPSAGFRAGRSDGLGGLAYYWRRSLAKAKVDLGGEAVLRALRRRGKRGRAANQRDAFIIEIRLSARLEQ